MRIDISYRRTDLNSSDYWPLALLVGLGIGVGAGVAALWHRLRRPTKEASHAPPTL